MGGGRRSDSSPRRPASSRMASAKSAPARRAGRGQVEKPGNKGLLGTLRRRLAYDLSRYLGNAAGPCRRPDLVGNDPQAVLLASEPKHGLQEIASTPGIDPAGTQHDIRGPHVANGAFAGELGAAVGVDRAGRIVLEISARFRAIENIIRRVMDKERGQPAALLGQDADRGAVDDHASASSVSARSTAVYAAALTTTSGAMLRTMSRQTFGF